MPRVAEHAKSRSLANRDFIRRAYFYSREGGVDIDERVVKKKFGPV
jgi:hypothetical protein